MKKLSLFVLIIIGLFTGLSTAFAQVSADAYATATIAYAISIAKTEDLRFGAVLSPTSSGTVVIPATSDTPTDTGVTRVNSLVAGRAQFNVVGSSFAVYSVTVPVEIHISDGGSNTMTVDSLPINVRAQ